MCVPISLCNIQLLQRALAFIVDTEQKVNACHQDD